MRNSSDTIGSMGDGESRQTVEPSSRRSAKIPKPSTSPDSLRSLLEAALLGLAVSFLSSFFSGVVAVALMLGSVGALFLLIHGLPSTANEESATLRDQRRDRLSLLASAVPVGAALGGLSLLPVFPISAPYVPWAGVLDPDVFGYGARFHWYELLAAILIAGVACALFFRRQQAWETLGFAVAAVGGAVSVFSAFGPYFSDPVPTYLGWSTAVVLLVGGIALVSRGLARFRRKWRRPQRLTRSDFAHGIDAAPNAAADGSKESPDGVLWASNVKVDPRSQQFEHASESAKGLTRASRRFEAVPLGDRAARRNWPIFLLVGGSLLAVLTLAVALTKVPFADPLFLWLICLFVIASIALCASAVNLLNRWQSKRTAIATLTSAGALIALLFAFLALRPEPVRVEAQTEQTQSPATQSTQDARATPTPETENRPSSSATPTLSSERVTDRIEQGSLTLNEADSSKVEAWGMRIAAKSVRSTWADVRLTTDQKVCEASLDVGESIVMSNRQSADADYDRWYEVVLESIEDYTATFAWSVGTGAAPAADPQDSCV